MGTALLKDSYSSKIEGKSTGSVKKSGRWTGSITIKMKLPHYLMRQPLFSEPQDRFCTIKPDTIGLSEIDL